jgi:succinoglycan biosynthesis protein ExoO
MNCDAGVSVIIPAYNAEAFIDRAVASALEQTLSPREVIVIDDCSSDGTGELLKVAAQGNEIIKVITLARNGGPSVARNAGIEAAQGDWIAILDADDAFAPDRLAMLVPFAVETGADFVADDLAYYDAVAGCITGNGMGRNTVLPDGSIRLHDFLAHNLADGRGLDWGLLKPIFRRDTLMKLGITYDTEMAHGEDFRFVVDLLLSGANFRILRQPLYLYTQRQGAASKRASGWTRTTIAYGKLAHAAQVLAQDPRIASDPQLVALLQQRARGLGRQDDAHFISGALRAGAFGEITKRMMKDPSFLPFMLRQIGRAMRRRMHTG